MKKKNTQSKQTNTTKQRAKKIDYGQKQYRIYLCTSEKYALYSNVSLSLNIKHHTLSDFVVLLFSHADYDAKLKEKLQFYFVSIYVF